MLRTMTTLTKFCEVVLVVVCACEGWWLSGGQTQ